MTSHYELDGKKVSLLGYGTTRMPAIGGGHSNIWTPGYSATGIDQPLFNRQVKRMLDLGINYFDTAPTYCCGDSESSLGKALKASGYRRSDYIIATKLSNFASQQYSLEACKQLFENSLKALQTDYVDCYLLHSIGNGGHGGKGGFSTFSRRFLENGALDWCAELRAQGRVKHLGFSFHGAKEAFDWCLEHHDKYHWDFVQIQMNYIDWNHAKEVNEQNTNAKTLYEELAKRDIPIVIMEPLLGGRLARFNYALAQELKPLDPEATLAKWALRFCGSFPKVMTVLSGMTYTEHIEENVATFSPLKPCSEAEFAALDRAAQKYLSLNTIPCNACNYCMPCPYGLDIVSIFQFRNAILTAKTKASAREIVAAYEKAVPEELRRADHCTGCGRCTPHCPQSINIPHEIAAIDEWIDGLKDRLVAK